MRIKRELRDLAQSIPSSFLTDGYPPVEFFFDESFQGEFRRCLREIGATEEDLRLLTISTELCARVDEDDERLAKRHDSDATPADMALMFLVDNEASEQNPMAAKELVGDVPGVNSREIALKVLRALRDSKPPLATARHGQKGGFWPTQEGRDRVTELRNHQSGRRPL